MSWTMTHLIVANEYLKKHPVADPELFLLASISPDGVHGRNDFDKEMKARTHYMQDGVKWGEIYTEKEMNDWFEVLGHFYRERSALCEKESDLIFLQGYTLHILVDIFNCSVLYGPKFLQFSSDVTRFRADYARENEIWDRYLYQTYPEAGALLRKLAAVISREFAEDPLVRLDGNGLVRLEHLKAHTLSSLERYEKALPAVTEGLTMIDDDKSDAFLRIVLEESERLLFDFPAPDGCFAFRTGNIA